MEAIGKVLKENTTFNIKIVINWAYIINKQPLPEDIYDTDVFIYQVYNPIDKNVEYHTDTVLKKLRDTVKTISVPFIAFNGYWPDATVDARNDLTKCGKLQFGQFPQQSCVLSKYVKLDEALSNYSKEHYNKLYVEKHFEGCLNKIATVEKDCDIKIYEFIKRHYKSKLLFHSIQHPTNYLISHVLNQILDILHIPSIPLTNELLRDHSVLILPCVQIHLGLKDLTYKLYGIGIVDEIAYVRLYFENINSRKI